LRAESKKKSPQNASQEKLRDISNYKLFMLNLDRVIACSIKLEQIFNDIDRKCEGDYIYGKSFIAETAIDITETLDMLSFYLNALNGGREIGLFYMLDNLKSQINKCFDKGENKRETEDTVPEILRDVINHVTRVSISSEALASLKLEDASTAHDLLVFCYNRIFGILDGWLQSVIAAGPEITRGSVPIIGIPISYLQQDEKPVLEMGFQAEEISDDRYSNPGALKIREGIYEVLNSGLYAPFLEQSYKDTDIQGMIFYSNETLALYNISDRFKIIIVANICDAVGGNYMNLLIGSVTPLIQSPSSHQLIKKLLDWLDFHSVSGYGFTTASIKNMTRSDMENHLNMLGKLLAFASFAAISPRDEKTVQQNIEIFLENIV